MYVINYCVNVIFNVGMQPETFGGEGGVGGSPTPEAKKNDGVREKIIFFARGPRHLSSPSRRTASPPNKLVYKLASSSCMNSMSSPRKIIAL